MNERITVIEPQPFVKAQVERILVDLGYEVVASDASPDLAIVAFGTASDDYERSVSSWLDEEAKTPIVATVFHVDKLVEVAGFDAVFASLVRPFNRARLAEAIIEAGGTSSVDESEIAVATESGSFVVDADQVLEAVTLEPAVGEVGVSVADVADVIEPPMTVFGPDSGVIKTFAPALVGAAELIASAAEQLVQIPQGPERNEAVLKLLLQAGIVADAE